MMLSDQNKTSQSLGSPGQSHTSPQIPRVQEPVRNDTSSDEWTGDEEYFSYEVRRQQRILEFQRRCAERAKWDPTHPERLQEAAARSREVRNLLLDGPLSPNATKATRFIKPVVPSYPEYREYR